MANTINWGKIYESTYWGNTDNNISWGKAYADLAGVVPALVSEFVSRVEADGGSVESTECMSTDLTFLVNNPEPVDFTGLLNDYSGAAAAYSLRLLDNTYSGNAIKVRRSSDNAEQDIAFVNNELDTASLETFAGSGDAFVTTWYDQSGNGNNSTQTTAASQPQIVSSGTIYMLNSKPAISGNGLKQLDISTELNIPNDFFIATTLQYDAHTMILGSNTDTINFLFSASLTQYRARIAGFTGYFSQNALALNTQYNSNVFKVGNSVDHSRNGELNGVQTGFTGRTFKINTLMNGYTGTSYALSGYAQEIIIWESDESTNRTGIETNINDFYSIY